MSKQMFILINKDAVDLTQMESFIQDRSVSFWRLKTKRGTIVHIYENTLEFEIVKNFISEHPVLRSML